MPAIGKDVASLFPQTEEAALQIALKYDLIYAHSDYVYIILPDLPRLSGANAPGASHAANGIFGALSHTYTHPPMGYGFPQGGENPPALFPLPVACIQNMTCLLLFPNLLTTMLPNFRIIRIYVLVLLLLRN